LSRADLSGAYFEAANLSEAFLTEANLNGSYFGNAILRGAYLAKTDLSGASFLKADLSGCDMKESKIIDVNFNYANLADGDITGATYRGVSTIGWYIKGIKAAYIYTCFTSSELDKHKYRKIFLQGQFEELYKSKHQSTPKSDKNGALFQYS
jgi:uncharacterized protein YjbI with pentapeptide repeats